MLEIKMERSMSGFVTVCCAARPLTTTATGWKMQELHFLLCKTRSSLVCNTGTRGLRTVRAEKSGTQKSGGIKMKTCTALTSPLNMANDLIYLITLRQVTYSIQMVPYSVLGLHLLYKWFKTLAVDIITNIQCFFSTYHSTYSSALNLLRTSHTQLWGQNYSLPQWCYYGTIHRSPRISQWFMCLSNSLQVYLSSFYKRTVRLS